MCASSEETALRDGIWCAVLIVGVRYVFVSGLLVQAICWEMAWASSSCSALRSSVCIRSKEYLGVMRERTLVGRILSKVMHHFPDGVDRWREPDYHSQNADNGFDWEGHVWKNADEI